MMWKILVLIVILSICSSIDGRGSSGDHDLELSNEKAQMFLRTVLNDDSDDADQSVDRRQSGTNCVPCKFKSFKCCSPNICIKKTFWNECMEIKPIKGGK